MQIRQAKPSQAEDFSNQAQAAAEAAAAAEFSSIDAATSAAASETSSAEAAAAAALSAQNAAITANVYPSKAAAQSAIDAGIIPPDSIFNVIGSTQANFVDQFQNVGGVATPTGKSSPASEYVAELSNTVDKLNFITSYISSIVPREQANKISGYQFIVTYFPGTTGLLGINDNGGLEIPGVIGNVQDYMTNLVSETFSSKVSGYQYVWLTEDKKTAVAAIDDNGYFWLAGMTEPVQTAIANAGGGGAERLIKPDGTGKIALFASESDSTPLWDYYPVASAEKVTNTGISFIYN